MRRGFFIKIDLLYKVLAGKNYFGRYPYNYYLLKDSDNNKEEIQEIKSAPGFRVSVYAFDDPMVFSFPDGNIFLSRSIVDGGGGFSIRNDAQFIALLIHEYIHIQHEHLLYRWGVGGAINDFIREKRKNNWTRWLTILPINYSNTVYSTRDLSSVIFIDFNLECLADFYTALILKYMGYDIREYIDLLSNIKSYNDSLKENKFRKAESFLLENRIAFLKNLLDPQVGEVKYLIIKNADDGRLYSYEFDKYPDMKSYAVYWYAVFAKLNIPVENGSYMFYEGGDINKPIGRFSAIVFPDKIIAIPIFPFIN